ncbi:hypothetical protein AKJ09_02113 [Labilithrix luteola]|uniref:Uncharacterized protein n=1 Tax=Labilithrix luteola TaxID=1391654 RepID=A0A0K1PQQ6_9BACT|nr:hypothetical protein AKJ09_02113 [Labilithrix luteola]
MVVILSKVRDPRLSRLPTVEDVPVATSAERVHLLGEEACCRPT